MRSFTCPSCGQLVYVDNDLCLRCKTALAYDPERMAMVEVDPSDVRCGHHGTIGCSWLVRDDNPLCRSCRLTTVHPPDGDLEGQQAWAEAEREKRRLVVQMDDLGLDISGAAFELRSSAHEQVTIGHADGVITLDVLETDDVRRVRMREQMGEAYRTMLGHFRHEIGHYLWQTLVADTPNIDACRKVFGDERESYADALERHYESPDPDNWAEEYVSVYATAHPWEDFAETMAHYFHIRSALQTADSFGLRMEGDTERDPDSPGQTQSMGEGQTQSSGSVPTAQDREIDELIGRWLPFTYALNAVNLAMGTSPLYPFVLSPTVIDKLGWIHNLVMDSSSPAGATPPRPPRHASQN